MPSLAEQEREQEEDVPCQHDQDQQQGDTSVHPQQDNSDVDEQSVGDRIEHAAVPALGVQPAR
jgi:hypothetical protein